MNKIILLALLGLFVSTVGTKSYAAFPIKEKMTSTTIVKDNTESGKIAIQDAKGEAKSELEAAASAAAAGGGGKQVLAAVLCWVFGVIGIHDFVLGNITKGLMHLGLFILGITLLAIGLSASVLGKASISPLAIIGWLIFLGNLVWTMVDFVRILIGKYPGI